MFKKKQVNDWNKYDTTYRQKVDELYSANDSLVKIINSVIAKKGIVDILPEGASKEAFEIELKEEQYKLTCCIGNYDTALSEVRRYWSQHYSQFEHCAQWAPNRYSTAHQIIEKTYISFYK